ncbi:hypothetical protein FSP39_000154 [Pinctada imbricata]|uniref:RCC1-like domain-containing protein n=1 Tax=Pinctada imbricata TaxID=66713 RepID=A0AA88YKE8_PINIB|nr:hypothetical protein FSP39_000154 [Pinctada imbricata]
MFPLFELVRLLSIKDEQDNGKSHHITHYALREAGEVNILAVSCNNGFVLLRYSSGTKDAIVQQVPWPQDRVISTLCIDPTVTWLLVITEECSLFIVPARSVLDPDAKVNQLWRVDDVTITKVRKPKGAPSVSLWWHTLDDQQVAIIGTKSGELIFVDLIKRGIVHELQLESSIVNLELVEDDHQMTNHLLVTGHAGTQWKVLLQSRTHEILVLQDREEKELTELGFDQIDGRQLPMYSITSCTEEIKHLFMPMRFYQFPKSVMLCPQYAKGRHFITAHDNKSSTYQIFDSNIEHLPLFVYKLPTGSYNILLSDKVIHTMTRLSGEKRLLILANQMAESSIEDTKEFNKDSVIQQFDLPLGEKLLGVMAKSFPFYWHEKHEEELKQSMGTNQSKSVLPGISQSETASADPDQSQSSYDIDVPSHTVLNGCIIVTDAGVYECRPRISPERLFLDLAIQQTDPSVTDSLGISLGLDLHALYELAAEYSVQIGNYSHASKLFRSSKCKFVKRVASFANHGRVPEVTSLLKQVMTLPGSEISTADRKKLADMALQCYVYQARQNPGDTQLQANLIDFLISNFSYHETKALTLLTENGMVEVLLEMAKARGLVLEALQLLASYNHFILSPAMISGLVSKGFTSHLIQAANGTFLQFLSPSSLVELLCSKHQFAFQHFTLFQPIIIDLGVKDLETLTLTFDPSRNPLRSHIARQMGSRRRAGSITSISSTASDGEGSLSEATIPEPSRLVDFFLTVLLQLHKIREKEGSIPNIQELLCTDYKEVQRNIPDNKPEVTRQRLLCKPYPIGAGHQHVALVRDGDLYTWGRNSNGRLGHGDLALDNTVSPPCRVETLHMLQIRVISVSCGGEHTIALTQQGVYGWGSSKYGQVGLGTRHIYSRPMFLDTLTSTPCVQVVCGQYHSLALTAQAEVYSWGWGVHGQLGHHAIEDCLKPKKIAFLSDKQVTKISAGYCHTLALTALGQVWAFGCGFFGQLGLGNNSKQTWPVQITTLKDKIVEISTKFFHNIAVSAQNKVYTWGCHPYSLRFVAHAARKARQSGKFLGDPVERYLQPEEVDTCYINGRIKQSVCGSSHSAVITIDGDVYTWGRNIEGQIGNNSKQDMKLPSMVTSINDRKVCHMTSGGEFNISLDSDGLVWVWGKNDYGQLGLEKVESTQSHYIHMNRSIRHQSSAMTSSEVMVPMVCHGLPPSRPKSLLHQTSAFNKSDSYDSSDGDIWMSGGMYDDRHLDLLPDLQTLGNVKYGRVVLHHVLEHLSDFCNIVHILRKCTDLQDYLSTVIHLSDFCNSVHILRKCTDLQDYLSAVIVCVHKLDYAQALVFHLLALQRYRDHYKEKFSAITLAVINHYLQLCVNQETSASQKEENYRLILLQVLHFWDKESLPVNELENLLHTYIDSLCCILATFLFWSPHQGNNEDSTTESEEDLTSPAKIGMSDSLRKAISTKFSLDVLQRVTDRILAHDFEKKHPVTSACLKPLLKLERSDLDLQPSDKLIPFEQLWQDVVQNLQKGAESRQSIYITRSEVDHLDEKLHQATYPSGENTANTAAVMFTCGHYYTKTAFIDDVLVKFHKELSQGPASLPESAGILVQYYNRQGLLPLACPKCVVNAIHSIKA